MLKKLMALSLYAATLTATAATSTNLTLKGPIAQVLDVEVTPLALATSLPLGQALSRQKVATLTEKSNSRTGYKISASSLNGGKLLRAGDSGSFINYQLRYNNRNITLQTAPNVIRTNSRRGQFQRNLNISYSKPSSSLPSGDYTDVVTFTIVAN